MKFLSDEGADVIYWFADFDDQINEELAERAASHLRRKGTKLIIHDFKGQLAKGGTKPHLEMMARKTGGEFFLKLYNK